MEKLVCVQYPHLFKPMQAVNAVILLICLGSATTIDGGGMLWFVTLLSLVVSTVATVIFMMDKDDPVVTSVTGGAFSWNVLEFGYSSILSVLCALCFALAFAYAAHVPAYGNSTGYALTGVFMLVQTVFYAVPSMLLYDRFQCEVQYGNSASFNDPFQQQQQQCHNNNNNINGTENNNDQRYQTANIV